MMNIIVMIISKVTIRTIIKFGSSMIIVGHWNSSELVRLSSSGLKCGSSRLMWTQIWLAHWFMFMFMSASAGPAGFREPNHYHCNNGMWQPYPDARPSKVPAEAAHMPSGREHTLPPFPPGPLGLQSFKVLRVVGVLVFGSVIRRLGSLAPTGVLRWPVLNIL